MERSLTIMSNRRKSSNNEETCDSCGETTTKIQGKVICFLCKDYSHLACSDVTAAVSKPVADGILFFACRMCRTSVKISDVAHRASTKDEYIITVNAEMERIIKVTNDTWLTYEAKLGEQTTKSIEINRNLELCNVNRAKAARIIQQLKNAPTDDKYKQLLSFHQNTLKNHADHTLQMDTQVNVLKTKILSLETEIKELKFKGDVQQSKKRRLGGDDDGDKVLIKSKSVTAKPRIATPTMTNAEAVRQSYDTPIAQMRIVVFGSDNAKKITPTRITRGQNNEWKK